MASSPPGSRSLLEKKVFSLWFMDDIGKQIWSWIKEKTSSPLYLTFIGFYIAWNWKLFYTLFFEDESLLILSRLDSALEYRFFENETLNLISHFLPPLILTYLAIIYLPKLNHWAHSIYLENYFIRKEAYDIKNLEYEKRKTERLGQKAVEKEEQKKQKVKIEQALTQEEKWEEESKQILLNIKNIEAIKSGSGIVYGHNGWFATDHRLNRTYLDPAYLSRLDTLGLTIVDSERLQFTDKGKFFVRLLQSKGLL